MLSRVFPAPQRLEAEEAFLNTVLTALSAAQLAVRNRGFPSQRVNLPRCKFKQGEKKKKNLSENINVNVCSISIPSLEMC